MSKNRIAIVNSSSFGRIFPEHLERLKKIGPVDRFELDSAIDGQKLAEILRGFNYIVASVTPFFTKAFFDHKDELKLIARHGIGYNSIDIQAARDHGTYVTIVPPLVERDAVAENCITNLLSVLRKTYSASKAVLQGNWDRRAEFIGHGLSEKTVGIIGFGNIGSRIGEILARGFQCQVLAYDPHVDAETIQASDARKVELSTLLHSSDVICLSASLNTDNYHMLSWQAFQAMKDGVYISLCSRGALIDQDAMIEALQTGKVAGFATDVLEVEPPDKDHPYLAFENVLVTPHTSAYTYECLRQMGEKCVQDCEDVFQGKIPKGKVD